MRLLLFVAAIVQLVIAEADIATVPHETSSNIVPGVRCDSLATADPELTVCSPRHTLLNFRLALASNVALLHLTRNYTMTSPGAGLSGKSLVNSRAML
jgi:hypothetical protein